MLWGWCALTGMVLLLGTYSLRNSVFNADAWAYFELSNTFGGDFYRITTWRTFAATELYSMSFPPLWPAVIRLTRAGADFGIYSAVIANLLLLLVGAAIFERAARSAFEARGTGAWLMALLSAYTPFADEVMTGRSMPLTLCLIGLQIAVWFRPGPMSLARGGLFGALLGLTVMTRFDYAPVAAILWGLCAWRIRRPAGLLISMGAGLLMLSPWIFYSLHHFGTAFATDNALTAAATDPRSYVTDFHAAPPPTLPDDVGAWLRKVSGNILRMAVSLGWAAHDAVLLLPLLFTTAWMWGDGRGAAAAGGSRRPASRCRSLVVFGIALTAAWAGYIATGYVDRRYFSPVLAYALWVLLGTALSGRFSAPARTLIYATGVTVLFASFVRLYPSINDGPLQFDSGNRQPGPFTALTACLDRNHIRRDATVMFAIDDAAAAKFGALTGRRAAMFPRNWDRLSARDVGQFLHRFNVRYVYLTQPGQHQQFEGRAQLQPVPGCTAALHRVYPLQ